MNTHTREEIKGKMRDLFTVEELETIANMLQNGHIEHLAAVIDVADQEHEFWLGEYMNLYRPEHEVVDSKVEQEILDLHKKGEEIDTPEKEKFWEARLKLEREGKPLPALEGALKALDETPEGASVPEPKAVPETNSADVDFTKKQLMEKLAILGVSFKETENKAALFAKLQKAVSEKVPVANQTAENADKTV